MFFLGQDNGRRSSGQEIGAKAANLHFLRSRNYAVPAGFVLSDKKEIETSCSGPLDQIGGFPVAVRSSGHLEDLQDASFAGQYETFLNVGSEKELISCIQACFHSADSVRVQTYLKSRNLRHDAGDDKLFSVIVQKMVDVLYGGVAFSMDPTNGKEEYFLLEVCSGVGERLVSGRTSPSRYAIHVETMETESCDPGNENVLLSPKQIREIGDHLLRIQSDFGSPQDVEWAIDKTGRLWILQSRPITSIKWRTDLGEYTNADLKDGGISSAVCSPMMFSLYNICFSRSMDRYLSSLRLLKRRAGRVWMTHKYGRAYWNAGIIKQALCKIPGFNEEHFDLDLGIEKDYGHEGPYVTPMNLKTLLRAVPVLLGLKLEYAKCRRMIERFQEKFERLDRERLSEIDLFESISDDEFLSGLESMILHYYVFTETSYFRALYNNSNFESDFKKFILRMDQAIGGTTPLLELMLGLNEISHLKIQEGMVELLRTAEAPPHGSAEWQEQLQAFIRRFYFHGDTALDLTTPRWGEAPEIIARRVESMLRTGIRPGDPEKIKNDQKRRYLKARQDVLARIRRAGLFSRLKYGITFRKAVERLRYFMISKEWMREFSTRSYYVVRRYLLEAGTRLRNLGVFEASDDVFFLHMKELLDLFRNRRSIDKDRVQRKVVFRRRMCDSFRRFIPPNEFGQRLTERGLEPLITFEDGSKQLRGIGCSPGTYEGFARVVEDLSEVKKIQGGEVLVTRFTDPAWTPVLGMVSAVVTEVGGILSHAAVISREYGIPAVLNSRGATAIIRTGQRIRVDGDRGVVTFM